MKTLPQRRLATDPARFPREIDPRTQTISRPLLPWWHHFSARWKNCTLCPLHQFRTRIVQFRGIIPARVCFIGEAPGESENDLGRPFVGPAGRLFDRLITDAGVEHGDFCVVNTVACLPWDTEKQTFRIPEKKEVKACSPRLQELVEHINPELLVLLGQVAANAIPQVQCETIRLMHPSAILRGGEKALDVKRFILTLKQAVQKLNLK